MVSTDSIRKNMRHQRKALNERQRRALSRAMARHLLNNGLFRSSKHIACYLAVGGEMDVTPVIRQIWRRKKRCYLPVLDSAYAQSMRFAPYFRHSVMTSNRFGIDEPRVGMRDKKPGRRLDLVLVPLVAFDRQGNRLGMGGGFYDRTFAFLHRQRRWRKPKLIGIAYEFQRLDALAAQPWDVCLDAVATEKQLHYFYNHAS